MKVSIIGVGRVGSAVGLALVARELPRDLVLVGRSAEATKGEADDLAHAAAFGRPVRVVAGTIDDTFDSDVIVLSVGTGGPSNAGGSGDRAAAGAANWRAIRAMLPALSAGSPNAVTIVATNPVDAIATLVGRNNRWPASRVIGTGTLLDTMRLRVALSAELGIHPADVRAYVLGEHGDAQFAAFASATAGGAPVALPPPTLARLEDDARHAGHEVMRRRGYTNHGIALAIAELVEAIARDTRQVMPVASACDDDSASGAPSVWLSRPAIIGRAGVVRVVNVPLAGSERTAWARSRAAVAQTVESIEHATSDACEFVSRGSP